MWQAKQRLISKLEPEIGLGIIERVCNKTNVLDVFFPKIDELRTYTRTSASVERVFFKKGQKILLSSEQSKNHPHIVLDVQVKDGLAYYQIGLKTVCEDELSYQILESDSEIDSIFKAENSSQEAYNLRKEAQKLLSINDSKKTTGLLGPRVRPLAYQLYIAAEVSSRLKPKVLLADEVGLGKTIEAALILSAMKAKQRADRVLIVVPESLKHQWVAELYRRFNFTFALLDEERCLDEEQSHDDSAFMFNQNVIVSLDFLEKNPHRLEEALNCYWDLLILDEAHHLGWNEHAPTKKWQIAKELVGASQAALFLTATPSQKGLLTQFGLLHLMDPKRFYDYSEFIEETDNLHVIGNLAKEIQNGPMTQKLRNSLKKLFCEDLEILEFLNSLDLEETKSEEVTAFKKAKKRLLKMLVDRHGCSRVLFRNRREKIKGFPNRVLKSYPLVQDSNYKESIDAILGPVRTSVDDKTLVSIATGRFDSSFKNLYDGRFFWLLDCVKELKSEKFLILCSSKEKAQKVQKFLEEQTNLTRKVGLFHEDLTLIDRDKQAAFFAQDNGYQVLVCSEIGSEGRNFQFVKKLILFDIPMHPDLLEQRIGRLDRIGQGKEIEILVPWFLDSPEEVLFRFYHEGICAFERSWSGGSQILEEFADELLYLFGAFLPHSKNYNIRQKMMETFLSQVKKRVFALEQQIKDSVDILLDYNSFDIKVGEELLNEIEDLDDSPSLELFIRSLLDYFGVDYDDYDDRGSLIIKPDSMVFVDHIQGLQGLEDLTVTFSREVALVREDIAFLSFDHELVQGLFSAFLMGHKGALSLSQWQRSPFPAQVYIQILVIFELTAPKDLELKRYISSSVKEYCFLEGGKADPNSINILDKQLAPLTTKEIQMVGPRLKELLQKKMDFIYKQQDWVLALKEKAILKVKKEHTKEIERLEYLLKVANSVDKDEISFLQQRQTQIIGHIERGRLKLDAVRVIFGR